MNALAHSGKILIFLSFILLFSGFATAIEPISQVPYSGMLCSSPAVTMDWDINQIFYQKFTTDNVTFGVNKIQIYIPTNVTIDSGIYDKYIRLGIAKSNSTAPFGLFYTPKQWYDTGSLLTGFQCYSNYQKYRDIKGTYANFTFIAGNTTLSQNTDYYIAWYVWGDWGSTGHNVYWSVGSDPASFESYSVHRGNVSGSYSVAPWIDPFSNGHNLSYVLWGNQLTVGDVTVYDFSPKNTSITTLLEINNGNSYGTTWTYGLWLGNDTTDFDNFEQNITLKENDTDVNYGYMFNDLVPGKFYHVRGWAFKDSSSLPLVLGAESHFLTTPDPPTNLEVLSRDANYAELNWTKGIANESNIQTVIWFSSSLFVNPEGPPEDAVMVYNGTANTYNVTAGSKAGYFTAFSYLTAEEDGVNISKWSEYGESTNLSEPPLMDYRFNIYNEKDPYGFATIAGSGNSYEFSTKNHVINAMGSINQSSMGPIYCNASDILTVRLNVNNTIIERCYTITQSVYQDARNISVYKPNAPTTNGSTNVSKGWSFPVTINFIDQTSGRFSVPNYAIGIIRKNVENQTITVHSDYIQADMALRTFLVAGDQYYFYAKSDALDEIRLGGIIMYEGYYTVYVGTTPVTNETWRRYISITSGWTGDSGESKTIWLNLNDINHGLYETTFRLFNPDGTLISTNVFTLTTTPKAYNFNITYDTGNVNRSAYYANIFMKYHSGYLWWNDSTNYFWSTSTSGIEVDVDTLNEMLEDIIGPSPAYIPETVTTPEVSIPYSTLIVTGIVIVFFFLLPALYASFSVVFMSVILGLIRLVGLLSEADMPSITIGVIFFIGVLLFVFFMKKKAEKKEGEE